MLAEVLPFELKGQRLACRLIRRERKSLQLEVLPNMSVQMVAPPKLSLERCQDFLRRKKGWVASQQAFFAKFHPLTKPREYVAGETHLYLGKRLRLKVFNKGPVGVRATRTHLEVCLGRGHAAPRLIEAAVWTWYRDQAVGLFEARLQGCLAKIGLKAGEGPRKLVVRRFKARWGGMSRTGVLSLNLDLIRAPLECIDYVILHELCHIRHPRHDRDFWQLLERLVPDWRKRKDKLERLTA